MLYLAAGNLMVPRSGMDLVCREHLNELGRATGFSVYGVAVAPGIDGSPEPGVYSISNARVRHFVGDLKGEIFGWAQIWKKTKMVFGRVVPVMAYSFKSQAAAQHIRDLLRSNQFDVIVVDHYYAMANIGVLDLLRSPAKLVYISHDAMASHLVDMAEARSHWLTKLYCYLEAVRSHAVECILFGGSSFVVHLSDYESRRAAKRVGRHVGLLPLFAGSSEIESEADSVDPMGGFAKMVVFVGAPSHFPNAEAIDWIVQKLAPELARIAPELQVALLGQGTDAMSLPANVKGLGFVSAHRMRSVLAQCVCTISPVIHGRGIKVKVLDSISAGCPVLATAHSLRGFDQFCIEPQVQLDRPDELARNLLRLSRDQHARQSMRSSIQLRWQEFVNKRNQQLVSEIESLRV